MENLYRIVYSSFRNPICDEGEVKKIVEVSRNKNRRSGITGVLIHFESRFLQYLEGEKTIVESLFETIADDSRHTGVSQRNFEKISERVFPTWEMGYKELGDLYLGLEISDNDKERFDQILSGEIDFADSEISFLRIFLKGKG